MNEFERLKEEGRIEQVRVDKAKGRGLLKRSEKRLENQREREITEHTAFEILENTYEALREMMEAGMAADGFDPEDHVATIAYAQEHLSLEQLSSTGFTGSGS